MDIITIGSATRDNFLELDYKIIKWSKTPLKKAIVFPLGEKLEVNKVFSTIGGNAVNASVTFSRQGFKTGCFGKIGDDLAGRELIEKLAKDNVVPNFAISKDEPTAYSVLLLKNGERTILGYHGASNTLCKNDIGWESLKSNWWYLSLAGQSIELFKPLIEFAKQNNIKVAFNPSGYHIQNRRKEIMDSLKDLAFLVLNQGEAAELVKIPFYKEKEVFKKLDALMPGIVAVTNGPKGVTVSDGKYIYKAGIFKEEKLADRTGAGDAFGSGFVAGLIQQIRNLKLEIRNLPPKAVEYAIRLATANATAVVEKIGATEGILTKEEFESSPRFKNLNIKIQSL
ncbi:MAG: putative Ribokinase [Parcubacteria group bacterium Athens0714_26]|nr:MAG: putative Ribokinase [Parcubacteria group bacterium Athens0714_26]